MRVLWLCNIVLPDFSCEFSINKNPYGGWMSGLLHQLEQNKELKLGFCFPILDQARLRDGELNSHKYYSFWSKDNYYNETVERFKHILADFKPDIVHIWGTEYHHSSAMADACEALSIFDKMVINIQGLVSICAQHYFTDIPEQYKTLSVEGFETIEDGGKSLYERGKLEKRLLKKSRHAIGRTDWDRACVTQINPEINYHFCNEILRDTFYNYAGHWNVNTCERYSIFVSQAVYPIKNFHRLLQAMPAIISKFPGVHVYVGGADPTRETQYGISPYGRYILDLIDELDLSKHITFLGQINEEKMAERYLNSNVFVSASSIENESNSVSEAMILGVPVVSSYVGGIFNSLKDKKEGFLYQHDAEYMLAYYVCEIFSDDELAMTFSKNASAKMREKVDRFANYSAMLEIYKSL